ncbi:MAG TPA: Crp/Fnr family transcriptional regulator [Gammaproteobacteria bacterium]|jgi:CRP-like cAMP-binding protein|nr:Crp/Fnr family transcriptional regulator [Gammaproteobacteria bacterium]
MDLRSNSSINHRNFLSSLPLFENILEEEIESMLSHLKVKNFQKGEMFSFDVNNRPRLYLTLSGQFKLTKINIRGDEMILRVMNQGEVISPMHFSHYYDVSAEFIKDTTLLYFSESTVNSFVKKNPQFAKNIINMLAESIQTLMVTAEVWRLKNTKERLGWFLASVNNNNLGKLPISKSILASYLGMTPESLSRALKKLSDEGIELENNTIVQKTGKELCSYCDKVIGSNCNVFGSHDCPHFNS